MSKIVHENENYAVCINADGDGYEVVNTSYNVTEFDAISLPECIFAAENLNVVLTHKTYEWIAKRADSDVAQERRSAAKFTGLTTIN